MNVSVNYNGREDRFYVTFNHTIFELTLEEFDKLTEEVLDSLRTHSDMQRLNCRQKTKTDIINDAYDKLEHDLVVPHPVVKDLVDYKGMVY